MDALHAVDAGLKIVAVVAGAYSAHYWVKASQARVEASNEPDEDGWIPGSVTGTDENGEFDWFDTLRKQGELNSKAALGAAVAAAFIAAATAIELFL